MTITRGRACEGKTKYTKKVAGAVAAKRRAWLSPQYPYLCPFCGAWHVGHRPKKGKKVRGR
jgi:hypothetical protein